VTAGLGLWLLPQPLEPMPGNPGVMGGVLGISVAEVFLHRPQISALIGQVVAAGVAEHVRPDPGDGSLLVRYKGRDQISGSCKLAPTFW
jgi:hypothetical protein